MFHCSAFEFKTTPSHGANDCDVWQRQTTVTVCLCSGGQQLLSVFVWFQQCYLRTSLFRVERPHGSPQRIWVLPTSEARARVVSFQLGEQRRLFNESAAVERKRIFFFSILWRRSYWIISFQIENISKGLSNTANYFRFKPLSLLNLLEGNNQNPNNTYVMGPIYQPHKDYFMVHKTYLWKKYLRFNVG